MENLAILELSDSELADNMGHGIFVKQKAEISIGKNVEFLHNLNNNLNVDISSVRPEPPLDEDLPF